MSDWRRSPELRRRRWIRWLQFGAGLLFLVGIVAGFAQKL